MKAQSLPKCRQNIAHFARPTHTTQTNVVHDATNPFITKMIETIINETKALHSRTAMVTHTDKTVETIRIQIKKTLNAKLYLHLH
jgi:hypothetical protein